MPQCSTNNSKYLYYRVFHIWVIFMLQYCFNLVTFNIYFPLNVSFTCWRLTRSRGACSVVARSLLSQLRRSVSSRHLCRLSSGNPLGWRSRLSGLWMLHQCSRLPSCLRPLLDVPPSSPVTVSVFPASSSSFAVLSSATAQLPNCQAVLRLTTRFKPATIDYRLRILLPDYNFRTTTAGLLLRTTTAGLFLFGSCNLLQSHVAAKTLPANHSLTSQSALLSNSTTTMNI